MKTLWIGLGGALGSIARYQLDGWCQRRLGTSFPYGTLAVNLIGSFFIAVLMYVGLRTELLPPTVRIALTTGVIGGFTTYSTFNYETLRYLQDGAWGLGVLNVAATLAGCLVAGFIGWTAGRLLVGA
ncbi:MAG: fluoride efflux transporter CrcB [Myxococcaceae bacterium]|nr:fluoride efflux transporter CrcB [Myxococcaceae bacterium]MCI0673732.1 fluoride efflux transporter CrcB [Myxococcaceae bacterium]